MMKEVEAIKTLIHLNLLLAKKSITKKDFDFAIYRIQDARRSLEKIDTILKNY